MDHNEKKLNRDKLLLTEYKSQDKYLPSLSTHYILKKIVALESLFKIPGVESISISPEYTISNEGDGGHFLPNIFMENTYSVSLSKEIDTNSENFNKYQEAFDHLKKIDEEIIEYIVEEAYGQKNRIDIDHTIETLNDEFLNRDYATINRNDRFSHYLDIAGVYFLQDVVPTYQLFLSFLQEGLEYQKTQQSYGVDFDYFPVTDESWNKINNVIKSKNNFLFNYSIKIINDEIFENTANNSKKFIDFEISLFNDDPVSIQTYNNYDEWRKNYSNNKEKGINIRIDFSDNISIENKFSFIINELYNFLRPSDFFQNSYEKDLENKEKLKNLYYSQYENRMITSNIKKENIIEEKNKTKKRM